ncbi:MAG: nitrilase [Clostridiales bacterium]|nr:nitrilase [Clostridiales bacterium]
MVNIILNAIFKSKMRLSAIERYIDLLPAARDMPNVEENNTDEVRIAAVQREIKPVKRIESYIDMINGFIAEACKQRCRLVVFPEYNFFDLFGFIPGFIFLNNYLNKKAVADKGLTEDKSGENGLDASLFSPVFRAVSASIEDGLRRIFSLLAKKHGIYVYTGSFLVCRDQKLYNAGFLYGPDGRCIGSQFKIHLTDFEEKLGLSRGSSLSVHHLDIGRIAFPICMDATYFETFYAAAEQGAELIILPIANMEEYSLPRAIRGIWGRVQESYVYGIKASLNGWIAGMHFTGKAGIFAPLELTDKKDGVLAISSDYQGNELVICGVDYRKLRECRQQAEYYGDCNPVFEKGYVQKTYR